MSFRLGLKISSFVGRNLNPILDGAGGGEEGAKTVPPHQFSSVSSTNVGISQQNLNFNRFVTLG